MKQLLFSIMLIVMQPVVAQSDSSSQEENLYERHCALCHGPLDSSQKRNRSVEQIKTAIATVPAMKFRSDLGQLNTPDIEAIARLLSAAPIAVPPAAILVKNKYQLASFFETVFNPNDLPEINEIINANILSNGPLLGGSCLPQENSNCTGSDIHVGNRISSQVVRQGLIFKTCEQILDHNEALTGFLSYAGIPFPFEKINLKDLLKKYTRKQITPEVLDKFFQLGLVSGKDTSSLDSWRIVSLVLCQSTFTEVL